MIDPYLWYCESCRARGVQPPSREWWTRATVKPVQPRLSQAQLDAAEIERESKEGWAYGQLQP